jgi:hypothetical protein
MSYLFQIKHGTLNAYRFYDMLQVSDDLYHIMLHQVQLITMYEN